MKKDNKIISFDAVRRNKKMKNDTKWYNSVSIKIDIEKNGPHFCGKVLANKNTFSSTDILEIIYRIWFKITNGNIEINQKYINKDYKKEFTLIYYENPENGLDYHYICLPNINKSEIQEYLFSILVSNSLNYCAN